MVNTPAYLPKTTIFIFTKNVSTQLPFIDVNIVSFYLPHNYEFFDIIK